MTLILTGRLHPPRGSPRLYIDLHTAYLCARTSRNKKAAEIKAAFSSEYVPLEVEPKFRRQRSRRHVVRPAEGGEEVVECILVRQVDDGELRAPFVFVAVEQVVMADGEIEQIRGAMRGGLWSSFSVPAPALLIGWIQTAMPGTERQRRWSAWRGRRCRESGFEFLIGGQRVSEHILSIRRRLPVEGRRLRAIVIRADPVARCVARPPGRCRSAS